MRLIFQQLPKFIDCFLTAFSYRFFLTAFCALTTILPLAFRQLPDLALVVLGKSYEEIAALHFVVFAEEQIAEERFQIAPVALDAALVVGVVGADECIAEEPRIVPIQPTALREAQARIFRLLFCKTFQFICSQAIIY